MNMKIKIWNDKGLTGLNLVLKVNFFTLSVVFWNKHIAFIVSNEGTRAHLLYLIFNLKLPELKETLIWNLKQILYIRSV